MQKARHRNPVMREYAFLARHYDAWWKTYIRRSVQATLDRIDFRDGASHLDIGCGTGQLLQNVWRTNPSVQSTGLDLTFEMLQVADMRLGREVPLCCSNTTLLPFADETFDIITSTSVFHYVRTPEDALNEMNRVLRPGGNLVITDWCGNFIGYHFLDRFLAMVDPAHFRIYHMEELRSLLGMSRFTGINGDAYKINWFWGLMTVTARKPV